MYDSLLHHQPSFVAHRLPTNRRIPSESVTTNIPLNLASWLTIELPNKLTINFHHNYDELYFFHSFWVFSRSSSNWNQWLRKWITDCCCCWRWCGRKKCKFDFISNELKSFFNHVVCVVFITQPYSLWLSPMGSHQSTNKHSIISCFMINLRRPDRLWVTRRRWWWRCVVASRSQ